MLPNRQVELFERQRQHDELITCRKACEAVLRALATYFPDTFRGEFEMRLGALIAQMPVRGSEVPCETLLRAMCNLRAEIEAAFVEASVEADRNFRQPPEMQTVALVVSACPAFTERLSAPIGSEAELILAGKFLRTAIGAHLDAWHEASNLIGPLRAAILVLYVLQLCEDDIAFARNRIKNPAGLFRSLCRRLAVNSFDLKAELEALRKRHMT